MLLVVPVERWHLYFFLCMLTFCQTKKEEEEFSTGPLSVLMMSVKNNTQVLSKSLLYLVSAYLAILFFRTRQNNFIVA